MPFVPLPTASSLSFRAQLASLVSPLRRVRPRVPFYELGAHRVPTLWSLYRGLLKHAPGENTRAYLRRCFRKNQHITSPQRAQQHLRAGHKLLDAFVQAKNVDSHRCAVLARYDSILGTRLDKARRSAQRRAEAELAKFNRRPILTGAPMRASLYNRPLPRMKPQPKHISGMIAKRRRVRARRTSLHHELKSLREDLRLEAVFENELVKSGNAIETVFSDKLHEWDGPVRARLQSIHRSGMLDYARLASPFPPALVEKLKRFRGVRIAHHTRKRAEKRLELERRAACPSTMNDISS